MLARQVLMVLLAGLVLTLLATCARDPVKKAVEGDGPSASDIQASDVKDAVPRKEPLARYGNHSPYEVFGKKYYVLKSSENFHETGIASWYGSKFHGRRTSSGEPYDMHLATAAHKTLPLPTYAEITNLDNGRSVIVKINDRGPFREGRLIDLSYGAALRLDMVATGTARVEVRTIDVDGGEGAKMAGSSSAPLTWLQAGAYGNRDGAEDLARRLASADLQPVAINAANELYRVWLGPYTSTVDIESVIQRAIELGFERPHRVRR
jgi:rare lipoprotein A